MKAQALVPALLLFVVAGISSLGCSDDDESSGFSVVATTTQIGDFAREVGGDGLNLTVLLKPNQDAHDFEPEPSQIRALANADLVLRNGIGLDTFVNKTIEGSAAEAIVISERIR